MKIKIPCTLALALMESPAAMAVGLFNSILAPFFRDGNLENAIKTGAACADGTSGNGIFEWKKEGGNAKLAPKLAGKLLWAIGMHECNTPNP